MHYFSTDRDWLRIGFFLSCSLSTGVLGQGMISSMTSHFESDLKHAAGVRSTEYTRSVRWAKGGR